MATPRVMRTIRHVAEQQAMRRCTVYALICQGKLCQTRLGQAGHIRQAEVDRLLGNSTAP